MALPENIQTARRLEPVDIDQDSVCPENHQCDICADGEGEYDEEAAENPVDKLSYCFITARAMIYDRRKEMFKEIMEEDETGLFLRRHPVWKPRRGMGMGKRWRGVRGLMGNRRGGLKTLELRTSKGDTEMEAWLSKRVESL